MRLTRALVTGGAGFIGSHLCERLLQTGEYEVICLDNFYTGQKENIEHLLNNNRFEIYRHDVTLPYQLEVDEIYNLACPASPVQYQRHPVQTTKASVLGAINALELAQRLGVPILQASTSEVYGDPLIHPQTEGYFGNVNPIGLRSCYDEGKRCAESLFFDFHRLYGLDIKVVRIFNTYGPRMALNDGRVVTNFINQALTNTPITIYGKGSQTRSFCYVSDLVDALIAIMKEKRLTGQVVNVGNPNETTVKELADLIIRLTDSNSTLEYERLPEDDPVKRKPDIDKIKKHIDWKPSVNLETGLFETIQYIQDRYFKK